ncbi:trigger factor [Mycoplasmopsis gallinarum]
MSKKATYQPEKAQVVVNVKLNKEEWQKLRAEAKKELAKKVKIKGFRPGKAPQNLIDAAISAGEISSRAMDNYVRTNYNEFFALAKAEYDRTLGQPSLEIVKLSDAEAEFNLNFVADIDPATINLENVKTKLEFNIDLDKRVEETIEGQLKRNALLLPIAEEEVTKLGDTLTLNYKGYVNNEAFEGGEAEGFDLVLGSKTFIDTFEDQLVGKKVNDDVKVVVTFPKEYQVSHLAGKEAEFDVKIVAAKRPEEIKLTEENVSLLGLGEEVKTPEEARRVLKLILARTILLSDANIFVDKVIDEVIKNNKFVFNESIVNWQVEKRFNELNGMLKNQKIKLEEYLSLIGQDEKQLKELLAKEEIARLEQAVVVQKILNEVKPSLEITDNDYDLQYRLQSLQIPMTAYQVKNIAASNEAVKKQIASTIENEKVIELIVKKFDEKGYAKLMEKLNAADADIIANTSLEAPAEEAKEENK